MEVEFKKTHIPEDFSKTIAKQTFIIGPQYVHYITTVLFHGVSCCLGAMKNTQVPKAIVFRSIDHSFLAGAKVEHISNGDDPSNPASGRWDYVWTFYEDDLKGADCIDAASNSLINTYFIQSAITLYNMKFHDSSICMMLMTLMLEMIISWLKENVKEDDKATLFLTGVFKANAEVVDGKVEMGLVPEGEMKVLIKDDKAIQEA